MRIRKDCKPGMILTKTKYGWFVPCNKKNKPWGILGLNNMLFTGNYFKNI